MSDIIQKPALTPLLKFKNANNKLQIRKARCWQKDEATIIKNALKS